MRTRAKGQRSTARGALHPRRRELPVPALPSRPAAMFQIIDKWTQLWLYFSIPLVTYDVGPLVPPLLYRLLSHSVHVYLPAPSFYGRRRFVQLLEALYDDPLLLSS